MFSNNTRGGNSIGKLLTLLFKEANTNIALRNAINREDKSMEECFKHIQDVIDKTGINGISSESAVKIAIEYFTDHKDTTEYSATEDILQHLYAMATEDRQLAEAMKRADKTEKGLIDYIKFKASYEDGTKEYTEDDVVYGWAREYYVSDIIMPNLTPTPTKKAEPKATPKADKPKADKPTKKTRAEDLTPSMFDF